MGFTATKTEIESIGNGFVMERGTFVSDGGTTTGTITATAPNVDGPGITYILGFGASSDADTSVICATDAGDNKLKLTFGANNDGKYYIIGRAK